MGLKNLFKKKKYKTITIPQPEAGTIIPVDSPQDTIIFLPCPLQIKLDRSCICISCIFVNTCPMEQVCRRSSCEMAYIRGCTNYTNKNDPDTNNKQIVFKEGSNFDGSIFYFTSKKVMKNQERICNEEILPANREG